jgi:hypothetical protein
MRIGPFFPEPHHDTLSRRSVDFAHERDSLFALRDIGLVDAHGIDPYHSGAIGVPETSEGIEQVMPDLERFAIDGDWKERMWISPGV